MHFILTRTPQSRYCPPHFTEKKKQTVPEMSLNLPKALTQLESNRAGI